MTFGPVICLLCGSDTHRASECKWKPIRRDTRDDEFITTETIPASEPLTPEEEIDDDNWDGY